VGLWKMVLLPEPVQTHLKFGLILILAEGAIGAKYLSS